MKTTKRFVHSILWSKTERWLLPTCIIMLVACTRTVVVEPATDYQAASGSPSKTAAPRASAPGGNYQVVQGDTLYSIAFRNGVDFRDLASWNGIAQPYTIWPGQTLRLSATGTGSVTPAAKPAGVPATAAPVFEPVTAPAATAPSASAAPAVHASPAVATTAVAGTTIVPVAGKPASMQPQPPATTPVAPPPTPNKPSVVAAPAVASSPAAPVPSGGTRASGGVTWRWPAEGSLISRFKSGDAIPGIEIAGKAGDPVRAAADGVVVYSGNGLVGYGELIIIKHNDSLLSAYGHNRKRLVSEGQKVSAGQQIAEMGSTSAARDELQFQIRKDGNPVDPLGYLPAK